MAARHRMIEQLSEPHVRLLELEGLQAKREDEVEVEHLDVVGRQGETSRRE